MRFFVGAVLILLQPVVAFTGSSTPRARNQYKIYDIDCRIIKKECLRSGGFMMSSSDVFHSKTADLAEEEYRSNRVSFKSPKFRVYIEDTDAYGVMYNSNYVRAYERALLRYAPLSDRSKNHANEKWILSSVHSQKFRSSPDLGEEYVIRGELFECDVDVQTWDLEMVTDDVIHNSARVTITARMKPSILNNLNPNGKVDEKRYTTYHDEFDHYKFSSKNDHIYNYYVPLRNAMNFFERSRSDFLGGPNALRKMQMEDDLIWVVTGVENGQIFPGDDDNGPMDDIPVDMFLPEEEMEKVRNSISEESVEKVSPGKEAIVHTSFDVKRRGMILDCHHTLWMKEGNSKKRRLAQATCIIVALKGSTRRPTSKLPQWVLDKFASEI